MKPQCVCTVTHENVFPTEGHRQKISKVTALSLLCTTYQSSSLPTTCCRASKAGRRNKHGLCTCPSSIETDLKGARKLVQRNICCEMERTSGLLSSVSLKLTGSEGLLVLFISPSLVMHTVGKEAGKWVAWKTLLGPLPTCRLHEFLSFEKNSQDSTISHFQGRCIIRDVWMKEKMGVQQIPKKVILRPRPSHHGWPRTLIISYYRADHWAFRILKLRGNPVNWATISLISNDFLHSHTICELSITVLYCWEMYSCPFFVWLGSTFDRLLF